VVKCVNEFGIEGALQKDWLLVRDLEEQHEEEDVTPEVIGKADKTPPVAGAV
jgi:hypothetical protein